MSAWSEETRTFKGQGKQEWGSTRTGKPEAKGDIPKQAGAGYSCSIALSP